MTWNLHFVRILGAAIVLIGFIMAPSAALAHAGHAHAGPAPTAHQAKPDAKDVLGQAMRKASPTEKASPAEKALPAELKASPGLHSRLSDASGCHDRICCSGTPCAACCAVAIPELAESMPPTASAALTIPDDPARDSLDPDGLRRPPRFLA
jgi:hypothetical protein